MDEDLINPGEWFCSALDVAQMNQPDKKFKITSHSEMVINGRKTYVYRVLSRDTGRVWEFTCEEIWGPA